MTPEQIRIAMAEVDGWRRFDHYDGLFTQLDGTTLVKEAYVKEGCEVSYLGELPNYPEDLNAVHEVEKKLTQEQQNHYAWLLIQSCDNHMTWKPEEFPTVSVWEHGLTEVWFACHTTALQRCEAILRTLNKWKE